MFIVLYNSKEEALFEALIDAEEGDLFTVCRAEDMSSCISNGDVCQMCLRVTFRKGLTVDDILKMARTGRA